MTPRAWSSALLFAGILWAALIVALWLLLAAQTVGVEAWHDSAVPASAFTAVLPPQAAHAQAAWPWSAAYAAVKRARRSAVQWGAGPGHLTKEVFARLRLLPCTYCGSMPAGSVDHVIPFCSGGQNVMENLAPACLLCNQKKNRFDVSRVEIAG